jgi:hypothetical protein
VGVLTTEAYDKWANHEPINWNELYKSIVTATGSAGLAKLLGPSSEEASEAIANAISNIVNSLDHGESDPDPSSQDAYHIPAFDRCMETPSGDFNNQQDSTPAAPTGLLPGGVRP